MRGQIKIILLLVVAVFAVSCAPQLTKSKTAKSRNLADIYNPSKPALHPDVAVYHLNDSNSIAYLRIYPSELLFNEASPDGNLRARLRVNYELSRITDNKPEGIFLDSATIFRSLKRSEARNSYVVGLPMKAPTGSKYSLKLEVIDELRNTMNEMYRTVDKTSMFNSQNFNVLSATTGFPSFSNFFSPGELFKIQYNQQGKDSILVDYYSLDRTLPRPAFSSAPELPLKEFPDTSYIYPLSDTIKYELPVQGIYHFKVNFKSPAGLALFNFGPDFPRVRTPDDLLGPLVYLTTSSEFRDLRMESNRKLAIDNFWLRLNPDIESSKELIRVYYNRVLYANLYFSSYKEGWKTDRGMIYIVFGPPRLLERDPAYEKWSYFSRNNNRKIEFVFRRKENKFTDYDFQLERDINSSSSWREAIQAWRKGKVYSVSM